MEPKFKVGDACFYLDYGKIISGRVEGVIRLYNMDRSNFTGNKKITFKEFKYYVDIKESPETYGWKNNNEVYRTKEDLIASL